MALTLSTTDSKLRHRNGEQLTLIREITKPDADHDEECLPMVVVEFSDGTNVELFPDEIVSND